MGKSRFKITNPKFPQLVIAKGKHSDMYFVAASEEGLKKIALQILESRTMYFYKIDLPTTFEEYFENETKMSLNSYRETKASLPEEVSKEMKIGYFDFVDAEKSCARSYEDNKHNNKIYEMAMKALNEEDGTLAYRVLRNRSDFQYEGFEMEAIEIVG